MMWSHNTYEKLVNSETGLVGVVAYHLYKQDKIDWMVSFESEHGKQPTPEELKLYFYPTKGSAKSIQTYLERAEAEVNRVLDLTIGAELERRKKALDAKHSKLSQEFKDNAILTELRKKQGFWHSVGVNIVAALLASSLIAAGSLFLWLQGKMQDEQERTALAQQWKQEKNQQTLPVRRESE